MRSSTPALPLISKARKWANAGPNSYTNLRKILQASTGSEEMSRERLLPPAAPTITCLVVTTLGKVGTLMDQLKVSWAPNIPFTPASSSNTVTRHPYPSRAITEKVMIVDWQLNTRLMTTGPSLLLRASTLPRLLKKVKKKEQGSIISAIPQPTNFEQKKRAL